jgi:hypothetical protein
MIERRQPELNELTQAFIQPESERLLLEIKQPQTTHLQRSVIGERLSAIGDSRDGVGLHNGLGWLEWCEVLGGEITIKDRKLSVPSFYISKYLITYSQFQVFVDDPHIYNDDRWWEGINEKYRKQVVAEQRNKYGNYPRDNVSWYQAVAFTRWMNVQYHEKDLLPKRLISLVKETGAYDCQLNGNGSGPHKEEVTDVNTHGIKNGLTVVTVTLMRQV